MTGPSIRAVTAQRDHVLRVVWASGSITLVNMRPSLEEARFAPLRDEEVWRSVTTDGHTIRWTDGAGRTYDMADHEVCRFASGL